jgi:hypothetical protein
MNQLIRAGAITVAIFSSIGYASAQRASGYDHPDLTATQQRTVNQGLANSPSQPAPGAQPQVGDKVPDSRNAQSLPTNVTKSGSGGKEPAVRVTARPGPVDRSRFQNGLRNRHGHGFTDHRVEHGIELRYNRLQYQRFQPTAQINRGNDGRRNDVEANEVARGYRADALS